MASERSVAYFPGLPVFAGGVPRGRVNSIAFICSSCTGVFSSASEFEVIRPNPSTLPYNSNDMNTHVKYYTLKHIISHSK